MLHSLELVNGSADSLRHAFHKNAYADRGQTIFQIVSALQGNFGSQRDLLLPGGIAKQNSPIAYECSLLHFFLPAEPEDLRWRSAGQFHADRVIPIQDCKIICLLVFEDAGFSVDIRFEGAMAIEMVGRDIEHDGHLGPEDLNRLKLEARDLQNDD